MKLEERLLYVRSLKFVERPIITEDDLTMTSFALALRDEIQFRGIMVMCKNNPILRPMMTMFLKQYAEYVSKDN